MNTSERNVVLRDTAPSRDGAYKTSVDWYLVRPILNIILMREEEFIDVVITALYY